MNDLRYKKYDKNDIDDIAEKQGDALRKTGKRYGDNHKRTRQITTTYSQAELNRLFNKDN